LGEEFGNPLQAVARVVELEDAADHGAFVWVWDTFDMGTEWSSMSIGPDEHVPIPIAEYTSTSHLPSEDESNMGLVYALARCLPMGFVRAGLEGRHDLVLPALGRERLAVHVLENLDPGFRQLLDDVHRLGQFSADGLLFRDNQDFERWTTPQRCLEHALESGSALKLRA
jgi:hypothetical protein